ncbi:DUF177 domain-containing protein [Methylobacterium sp. Leaf466]|uniref:YceD family protein n=1 Tax=Methylobacterium sp. Leaf466 TaxID=1736386 RepID=UPI0006F9DADF|nr:DUF177 domain-containing protein [Methylobacterium sp. Leaf466]KQT90562.1 metal-binding protein [Methylobacterium sp. Leaf466]
MTRHDHPPRHDRSRDPKPGPLSRPTRVDRLRKEGSEVIVTATPAECLALAADFKIPAIRDLVGRFRVAGPSSRLIVTGTVTALVTQTCTVSLDPFEAPVSEPAEVVFTDTDILAGTDAEEVDVPDPIVGNTIDFGTLTAEFLALGLDPYPRKPGIAFTPVIEDAEPGPFDPLGQPPGRQD